MRINKYLATCGVASRRKCEEYISSGRVCVNGQVTRNLACDVNEQTDVVQLDGKTVCLQQEFEYYILNKPKGYISSVLDDRGRKVVTSLIYTNSRIFPIGRLDYNSEGMLLLTNDGDLMNKLTHPKHAIGKTYVVKILGGIRQDIVKKLEAGVVIDGHKLQPCQITILNKEPNKTTLQITIYEGRNREIRKMFESVNKQVVALERIKIADFEMKNLKRGEYRKLTKQEIEYLKSL